MRGFLFITELCWKNVEGVKREIKTCTFCIAFNLQLSPNLFLSKYFVGEEKVKEIKNALWTAEQKS